MIFCSILFFKGQSYLKFEISSVLEMMKINLPKNKFLNMKLHVVKDKLFLYLRRETTSKFLFKITLEN